MKIAAFGFLLVFLISCSNNSEKEKSEPIESEAYSNKQIVEPYSQALNSIASSGLENYKRLKDSYPLFGRWVISNSLANFNYLYEIYKVENAYVGVSMHKNFDYYTEILDRKEDFFHIKGSDIYYEIRPSMIMNFYNKNGSQIDDSYEAFFISENSDQFISRKVKNIVDSLYLVKSFLPESSGQEIREPLDEAKLTKEEKELLETWKKLLAELMEFKNTEHFKQYGFAREDDYNGWMERVKKLQDNEVLNEKGFLFGDLWVLAIEYVPAGQETGATKLFHEKFYRALHPVKE